MPENEKTISDVFSLCGMGNKVKEDEEAQCFIVIDTLPVYDKRICSFHWLDLHYSNQNKFLKMNFVMKV